MGPERRVGARLSRAQDAFDCVASPATVGRRTVSGTAFFTSPPTSRTHCSAAMRYVVLQVLRPSPYGSSRGASWGWWVCCRGTAADAECDRRSWVHARSRRYGRLVSASSPQSRPRITGYCVAPWRGRRACRDHWSGFWRAGQATRLPRRTCVLGDVPSKVVHNALCALSDQAPRSRGPACHAPSRSTGGSPAWTSSCRLVSRGPVSARMRSAARPAGRRAQLRVTGSPRRMVPPLATEA
jgi:hypothetical protein